MTSKTTLQWVRGGIKGIILSSLLSFLSAPIMAEAAEEIRTSKSINFASSAEIDKATKDVLLKQAETNLNAPLIKQGFRAESSVAAVHVGGTSYDNQGVMWIYNASTDLISDFDGDDFYHRFSVTIDADTEYDVAYVYAMLYLSYEGGPWNHYSTSNAYHIYADSSHDAFVVETELGDGFPPGYYDVRIVLYDADTDASVMNYGPYDDASLSTLPLEDSYYDDGYSESYYPIETEIVIAGSGSMSWMLALPVLITVVRRLARRYHYMG